MNTLKIIATGTILMLSSVAHAQDVKFADIDVTVELDDIDNANALDFWPAIEADMEKVMTERVASMYAPDGLDIDVSVTEVSLSGSALLKDEGEFNTLQGWVYVRDEDNGNLVDSFKINLRAETGQVGLKDGMILLPDMKDFYVALLNGFADSTVNKVMEAVK